jgi:3-hydroxy acid dehydrogenase/malonic semialdehyde reductase
MQPGPQAFTPAPGPITPEDIADTVWWVVSRPAHVNINVISMMPVCQASGPLAVHREKT